MPIEVEGPDGAVVEFPDGTPNDVMQRAMAQHYGAPKTSGGGGLDTTNLRPADAKGAWDRASAMLEKRIAGMSPKSQKLARDRFFNDPRIRSIREAAARPVTTTRKEEVQKIARRNLESKRGRRREATSRNALYEAPVAGNIFRLLDATVNPNISTAAAAGIEQSQFDLPARFEGLVRTLGEGGDYEQNFRIAQAENRARQDRAPVAGAAGNIIGAIGSGGAVTAGVRGLGRLAASRGPAAVRVGGRALEGAATLREGQKVRNALKIVGAGSAGGAAQAAGEGGDIATGAAVGAVAPAALVGGAKLTGWLGKRAADILGVRSSRSIIRSLTKATQEELAGRLAEYRTRGVEPTLFEILPLADRNRLAKNVVGSSDEALEVAQEAIARRAGNMGPEMAARVEDLTGGGRRQIEGTMVDDMTEARGGAIPDDVALAAQASRSPIDLKNLQQAESGAHMAPVQDMQVADDVESLFPRALSRNEETGEIAEVYSDPEVNAAIRNAAGSMTLRRSPDDPTAAVSGINANEISQVIRQLGKVPPESKEWGAAQRAIAHLLDETESRAPQAAEQINRMRSAYAARARQVEGMAEGARTRTRAEVPVESAKQARTVRNAFDTPEGASGRFLGQSNELGRRFTETTPEGAARAAATLPADRAALTQNLGDDVAQGLVDTAETQTRAQRALASLSGKQGAEADALAPEDLAGVIFGLSPQSMIRTKLWAIDRLTRLSRLPEPTARNLVELLFSQNPQQFQRAFGLLNSRVQGGNRMVRDMVGAIATGQLLAQDSMPPESVDMGNPMSEEPTVDGGIPGMLEPGNIDLNSRPVVQNDDGSISTVRSITVGFDDGVYVLPTVVNGRVVSEDEAIAHFKASGEHLGKFGDQASADAYAEQLHQDQAQQYAPQGGLPAPGGYPVDGQKSPYTPMLQQIEEAESPEMLDLIGRVANQESRGQHFDENGQPITSSAGAIGIMQVMPGTAPEAAKLAGLPYDENAYRFDPVYNMLIGIAYLSEQLRSFDGDVAKALAAYNAGPGAVQKALQAGGERGWLRLLPPETQNYVQTIL